MAGQITHILAGEKALEIVSSELSSAVLGRQGVFFRLGCQGPDIFYHNQRTKPSGLQYGSLCHRRGYGRLMEAAVASLPPQSRRVSTPAGAYLLGLATHAAVDRRTHPFIVYYAGWVDPARPESSRFRSCHPFLERLLDESLLASWRGLEPRQFDVESLVCGGLPERGYDGELVALWAAALRSTYARSAGEDEHLETRIANALDDARNFTRLTNPARTAMRPGNEDWFGYLDGKVGPRSIALVYPDSPPEELDLDSLGSEGWKHPAGDGRSFSSTYVQLVDEAVAEAAPVLGALAHGFETGEAATGLADLVGNGGLSINDPDGLPVPPRLSRPLPLAEILAREYERRLEWARSRVRH